MNYEAIDRRRADRRSAAATAHGACLSGSRHGALARLVAAICQDGRRLRLDRATQHGGNEITIFSIIANLMHFGLIIVGLPYSHAGQRR